MRPKSSSRLPLVLRESDHGACPHQCAGEGQTRRNHRDQNADLAQYGDRLSSRQYGKPVPHDIITDLITKYNEQDRCSAERYPAVPTNQFRTLYTIATESGTVSFEWTGDNGFTATESVNITVE